MGPWTPAPLGLSSVCDLGATVGQVYWRCIVEGLGSDTIEPARPPGTKGFRRWYVAADWCWEVGRMEGCWGMDVLAPGSVGSG